MKYTVLLCLIENLSFLSVKAFTVLKILLSTVINVVDKMSTAIVPENILRITKHCLQN